MSKSTEFAPGITITHKGGNCPYQAEGTIDGYQFYFRSRWEHWSLTICNDKAAPAGYRKWCEGDQWVFSQEYDGLGYAAGWINDDEFAEFLAIGVAEFRKRAVSGSPGRITEEDA